MTIANLKNIHFSLHIGRWCFKPGLLPTIAVFLLLPLLLHLGFWQRQRAIEKQQIIDQFALRAHQAPIPLANYYEPVYTPVQVSGSYDKNHIILLDNRIVNHQVGYDVLAPFTPSNGGPSILVNLGWIAKDATFNKETFQATQISGLVYQPEHTFLLARPKMEIAWPLIVEEIRIDQLSRILNRPLYPFTLLLNGSVPEITPATDIPSWAHLCPFLFEEKGLHRTTMRAFFFKQKRTNLSPIWAPVAGVISGTLPGNKGLTHHWEYVPSVSPARHRAYAFQWFALALTLVILYIKLNIGRIDRAV